MRYILILWSLMILISCEDSKERVMVWSDEFEINGTPDSARWKFDLGDGCPDNCGWETMSFF